MGLGIHVKLGTAVDDALDGASQVEVHERMGEPTTYCVRYEIDLGDRDLPDLTDANRGPGSELAIVVPVDNEEQVLVHGPVRGQRVRLEHGGTGSWLEVMGADKSLEMDRETKARVFASGSASDAVSTILGEYGFEADVEDTNDKHDDDTHALVQRDTDLRFVRRLARRYGFLFWVTSDAGGSHTGHFKRPPVDDEPAATLRINIANKEEPFTIATLDLSFDVERATSATAIQLKLEDKQDLDGSVVESPLTPLGKESFATIASGTRALRLATPVDDVGDLLQRAEGALIEEGWFVRASCDTYFSTLNRLVRAHTVVQLDGAGSRHGGKYFVTGVRHLINVTEHRMEIELARNAWGAQ
jgi:late control gene D protein (GPD)